MPLFWSRIEPDGSFLQQDFLEKPFFWSRTQVTQATLASSDHLSQPMPPADYFQGVAPTGRGGREDPVGHRSRGDHQAGSGLTPGAPTDIGDYLSSTHPQEAKAAAFCLFWLGTAG